VLADGPAADSLKKAPSASTYLLIWPAAGVCVYVGAISGCLLLQAGGRPRADPSLVMSNRNLSRVYDAIDAQNYKLALKLTDGILKKTPGWALVRAMKALVLVRMERREEGTALVAALAATKPCDTGVLSMMVWLPPPSLVPFLSLPAW
jgi:hypothetical protein